MSSPLRSAVNAAASALNAERMRLEVAVSNLANMESTRGPDGQPYKRRDVVLESSPTESFDDVLVDLLSAARAYQASSRPARAG